MKKVLALSALTFALALSACNGAVSRTPDPSTAKALPAPVTLTPAPFDLATDAAVLDRSSLSLTLVGRTLTLKETTIPLSVRLLLPDGTYSPATGGEQGQSLATAQYISPVVLGTVVEVGQAHFEKVATVTLKPRAAAGTGTVTPAQ